MANGIRTGDPRGFNKGRSSKFRKGSRVRQTSEEGRRKYRPKRCGNNNNDEDITPKTLNDKNHQVSSQKFWQIFNKLLWPRKGSLMKTQTRILDNRLYYTRKIELHRKGKKSRTVRITPILICGIWWPPHLTGKYGTRPFCWWVREQGRSPHASGISQKYLRPRRHSPY